MSRLDQDALDRPFKRADGHGEARARGCDHPGCPAEGVHRAPRSRERLNEYFWFCLEHVREYNRAWNYYAGMSEAEIERERQRDATWHRPSWPFGSVGREPWRAGEHGFRDDFGFFAEEHDEAAGARSAWENGGTAGDSAPTAAQARALDELDLAPPVTFQAVKARYKDLVKRLHPDANGGDRSQEDRLKAVNQAYAVLRMAYSR